LFSFLIAVKKPSLSVLIRAEIFPLGSNRAVSENRIGQP